MFSLNDWVERVDGSDMLFGGAGTDITRNDIGDAHSNEPYNAHGNARDSDMILGDNGNIHRLVGTNGTSNSAYLTFSYDNYGDLKLVARAAELLDYTVGGPDYDPTADQVAGNIGAADEVHGESGDDSIYGMVGSDVLFGEGQDDDLIGGYGNDWISGGTGDDGVLGDDGRIFTSRNGTAEALYDIAATTQEDINTPGNLQQAIINVTDQLKKIVDLTPFNLNAGETTDLSHTKVFSDPQSADDIIYGGWGNDFLHGGDGDDAMSGAEALAPFYTAPANSGNVLDYNSTSGMFALYNEYAGMEKINGFLLNFDATAGDPTLEATEGPIDSRSTSTTNKNTDGDDAIFGDLGNDWIVGGTGKDHLYGGWGNDLLNADDDLETNGGVNDGTDMDATYEDIAFGGAGIDVLIGNTGGDRLIDWAGEFNSYLVPFSPFGAATVSRTLQPQLPEYLYALSKSDGADQTLGEDAARNGEPYGEIGLVKQRDASWEDATGSPRDPQPGNTSGAPRDVLRSANFTNVTTAESGFLADSGTWNVSGGKLQATSSSATTDAVSIASGDTYVIDATGKQIRKADRMLPSYYEIQATVNAPKAASGWKSNGYIIFDYYSPTDFKFAGINITSGKLEIGHRTANGWVIDAQLSKNLRSGTDYSLGLVVDGVNSAAGTSNVTLTVGTSVLTYAYTDRVTTAQL